MPMQELEPISLGLWICCSKHVDVVEKETPPRWLA
jgi:hypothetical protein